MVRISRLVQPLLVGGICIYFLRYIRFLSRKGVFQLKLRNVFVGIISLTLLAACGQSDPEPQAQPAAEEAAEDDFPDLIIPENE